MYHNIFFLFQTSEHINLKVLGQDNAIIQFKIKKHTPLKKLMNAYCERASLSMATVRFRFDGQAINELDTPDTLEMEEGDTIEVYQQQTGGQFKDLIKTRSCKDSVKYKDKTSDNTQLKYCSNRKYCAPWTMTDVL